ncbi:hypothetical protein HOC01_05700 [archaeon]|jgi:uridine kinase|nr:hypothetical protein [archaeon]MBT6697665.1 hypothetical protein [archaeon]
MSIVFNDFEEAFSLVLKSYFSFRNDNSDENSKRPCVISVCGGTGSGKTTISLKLKDFFETRGESVEILEMDHYYENEEYCGKTGELKKDEEFPWKIEMDLFLEHVRHLLFGNFVLRPNFLYTKQGIGYRCQESSHKLYSKSVLIIEGVHALDSQLLEFVDFGVFVDADDDVRLSRRIARDLKERERSEEQTRAYWEKYAFKEYKMHVIPQKERADIVIVNNS